MVGDVDTRQSTSGLVVTFTSSVMLWKSRLLKCIALLTTEVEFIATTKAFKEMLWFKRLLDEIGFEKD